MNTFQDKFIVI